MRNKKTRRNVTPWLSFILLYGCVDKCGKKKKIVFCVPIEYFAKSSAGEKI